MPIFKIYFSRKACLQLNKIQISPRWNALVNDYLSNRKNLPVLEQFKLESASDFFYTGIKHKDGLSTYFGTYFMPFGVFFTSRISLNNIILELF